MVAYPLRWVCALRRGPWVCTKVLACLTQLVGQEKKAKTTDRRKLTQATVVTSETVIQLREQRERVDAVKAARKVKKESTQPGPPRNAQKRTRLNTPSPPDTSTVPPTPLPLPSFDEAEELWEEMEALEVGGDSVAGSSRGGSGRQSG